MSEKIKSKQMWDEQEKFALFLLKHILNELKNEWFTFETNIGNYCLIYINDDW